MGAMDGLSVTPRDMLAMVPGLVALATALIGIGRASQRLRTLELQVKELIGLAEAVTRIDERTRQAKEDHKLLRNEMRSVDQKLDRLIERRTPTN